MKQIRQNKKHNFRIYEQGKYSNISGYELAYILTDYNGNYIKKFSSYELLINYLNDRLGVNWK